MALVVTNDVKSYLQYSKDGNDGLVATLITRVESELKTALDDVDFDAVSDYTEYTEYYSGDNTFELLTRKYPIRSVTSIHIDSDRTFDATTLVDSAEIIDARFYAGIIALESTLFTVGRGNVKVVYKAGWKTTDAPEVFKQIIINRVVALLLEGVGGVNVVEASDFTYRPGKLREEADRLFEPFKRMS